MLISNYLKTEDIEDYIVFITDSCDSLTDSDERMVTTIRLVKAVNYTDYSIQLLKDYLKACLKHSANSLDHTTVDEARNILKDYKVMRDEQEKCFSNNSLMCKLENKVNKGV